MVMLKLSLISTFSVLFWMDISYSSNLYHLCNGPALNPFHKATSYSVISTSGCSSQIMIKSCPACRKLTYIAKCSSGVNTSSAHRKATGLNYSKPRLIPHCLTNPLGQTNLVIVLKCSSFCRVQVS